MSPISHPDILRGPDRADLVRSEVLADLFEATARNHPETTALVFGDESWHLVLGVIILLVVTAFCAACVASLVRRFAATYKIFRKQVT